ncbi:hypothetical protein NW752_009393 [Fusarium irregulare]|uniref:Uncharacterized protein n=1 Tax=Fusarium irregulare TaxID=2494466 RepID=A0A9W8PDQ4_9HYPO|nr:hypothetical protein NW766_012671 [Fusarium irregulare]KAJ4009098.1 hypothetical protein NW752_009393 [Fusarium irregulare]
MESPVLLHALMAFSSVTLSYFDTSYATIAVETRVRALSSLSKSILAEDIVQREINLAACLVLATAEISLGHRAEWHNHLQGAKHVVLSTHASQRDAMPLIGTEAVKASHEGRWLLRNFAYHDIMGSVVSGHSLLLDTNYPEDVSTPVDSYFGVAYEILLSIAKTTSLDLTGLDNVTTLSDVAMTKVNTTKAAISSIETSLCAWKCPNVVDAGLVHGTLFPERSASLPLRTHP